MAKNLTLEEKVKYMRIGLALCNIGINDAVAEVIVKVYEGIQQKKDNFSLRDAAKIEMEVTEKYTSKLELDEGQKP